MKTYVIMKKPQSAIAFNVPSPYWVCFSLKEAKQIVKELNKKSQWLEYWYESVPNTGNDIVKC